MDIGRFWKRKTTDSSVNNRPTLERDLKEAISNVNWGCSTAVLARIADKSYEPLEITHIMHTVWDSLSEKPKHWRIIFKGLTLLDYLLRNGSELVIETSRSPPYIQRYRNLMIFKYVEASADKGTGIRKKAEDIYELINDTDLLNKQRHQAKLTREKLVGIGVQGDHVPTINIKNERTENNLVPTNINYNESAAKNTSSHIGIMGDIYEEAHHKRAELTREKARKMRERNRQKLKRKELKSASETSDSEQCKSETCISVVKSKSSSVLIDQISDEPNNKWNASSNHLFVDDFEDWMKFDPKANMVPPRSEINRNVGTAQIPISNSGCSMNADRMIKMRHMHNIADETNNAGQIYSFSVGNQSSNQYRQNSPNFATQMKAETKYSSMNVPSMPLKELFQMGVPSNVDFSASDYNNQGIRQPGFQVTMRPRSVASGNLIPHINQANRQLPPQIERQSTPCSMGPSNSLLYINPRQQNSQSAGFSSVNNTSGSVLSKQFPMGYSSGGHTNPPVGQQLVQNISPQMSPTVLSQINRPIRQQINRPVSQELIQSTNQFMFRPMRQQISPQTFGQPTFEGNQRGFVQPYRQTDQNFARPMGNIYRPTAQQMGYHMGGQMQVHMGQPWDMPMRQRASEQMNPPVGQQIGQQLIRPMGQ